MDAVSAALDGLRITAVRVRPDAALGVRERHPHAAGFVLVTSGTCWMEVEHQPGGLLLRGGDLVVLTCGDRHTIVPETFEVAPSEGSRVNERKECSGGAANAGGWTSVICGVFEFDTMLSRRLVAVLPPVIHLSGADSIGGGWIRNALQFAAEEERRSHAGSYAVVNRLCEAVFTYAVRTHLSTTGATGNWLNALSDPRVGDAVALIHSNPERRWTVRSLAARVGMSRSSFAALFRAVVGETPLQHLIRCRMDKACELLTANGHSLMEVATKVGYDSDAAFSKVFKRCTGVAPGAYRAQSVVAGRPDRPDVPHISASPRY